MDEKEYEIDLAEVFGIIVNKLWVIILTTAICTAVTFCVSHWFIRPTYSASGSMYVLNSEKRDSDVLTQSDITTSQKLVDTYIVIMQSDVVLDKVVKDTNLGYTKDDIKKMFSAEAINNTEIFKVTVKNKNPKHAEIIANAFLKISPAEIMRVVKAGSVEVVDYATLPDKPTSPVLWLNTVIGGLAGLILSTMFIVLFEMINNRVKSEQDISKNFDLPLLGTVPDISKIKNKEGKRNVYK